MESCRGDGLELSFHPSIWWCSARSTKLLLRSRSPLSSPSLSHVSSTSSVSTGPAPLLDDMLDASKEINDVLTRSMLDGGMNASVSRFSGTKFIFSISSIRSDFGNNSKSSSLTFCFTTSITFRLASSSPPTTIMSS